MKNKSIPCKNLFEENCAVLYALEDLGIRNVKQILDLRVYDLMNMNRMDPIRVEEVLTNLYQKLNANAGVDDAMYFGMMSQYFDFTGWRKKHKDYSKVTVADIVLSDDINLLALQHIYDLVRRNFFKSNEYDSREYKYLDYQDYLKITRKINRERKNASKL